MPGSQLTLLYVKQKKTTHPLLPITFLNGVFAQANFKPKYKESKLTKCIKKLVRNQQYSEAKELVLNNKENHAYVGTMDHFGSFKVLTDPLIRKIKRKMKRSGWYPGSMQREKLFFAAFGFTTRYRCLTMSINMKFDKRFWGIGLGAFAILLRFLLNLSPQVVETIYSRGIFKIIRVVLDSIHWALPFSALYLLVGGLLFSIYWGIKKWKRSEGSFLGKSGQMGFTLMSALGWIIFLFLFLWGFNYGRVSLATQIKITLKPLKLVTVVEELTSLQPKLLKVRSGISGAKNDSSFTPEALPENTVEHLRKGLENQLLELGYPTTGFPTIRTGYPKGILWGFGAIGFYNPFTGECNVDPAVHPIDRPYVIAHELAHAYGFGDEGTCNFLAYLTCKNSNHPFIQYAGFFNYWQYLYYSYRRADPEGFAAFYENLPNGLKADVHAIEANNAAYPDFFPTSFRIATYDAYLKSQGVTDGHASYNQVVLLVYAWEQKENRLKKSE